MKRKSLVGKSKRNVRRWAAWYVERRKLRLTANRLLELALKESGTVPGVTKTKLRKAASRWARTHRDDSAPPSLLA